MDTALKLDNAITGVFDTAVSTVGGGIRELSGLGVDFAKDFLSAGMSFDTAISQVSATLLTTKDDFEATQVTVDGFSGSLRDLAKQMGATTKFTATQAGEALNYMALAGYDAQTSAEMLPKVLDLAAAGAMDLGTASDMVTDAQTALGLSLDDTTTLIDQMAKTASSSNTSVSQLGDAILTIGATGRQLKGGFTELNTALGILADNGIKASEGGNDLRRVLIRLTAPGTEAAKTMDSLGFSAYDAQGNIKSLPNMFTELNKAMEGYTEQQRNAAINDIFGQYALAGANALLNTSAERWQELTDKIVDSEGAAKEMADIQLDNLQGKMTILNSAVEGLKISFSDLFSGKASEYVESFTSGLGDVTKQIDQGDFKGGFYALGRTIVDLINKGADDILNSRDEISDFIDGIILFANKVGSTLIERGAEVLPVVTDLLLQLVGGAVSSLADYIGDEDNVEKIRVSLNLVIKKFDNFLHDHAQDFFTIVETIYDLAVEFLPQVFKLKRETTAAVIAAQIKKIFTNSWFEEDLRDSAKTGIGMHMGEGIAEGVSMSPVAGKNLFRKAILAILGAFTDGFEIHSPSKLFKREVGAYIGEGLVDGIYEKVKNLKGKINGIIDKIKQPFTDIVSRAKTWGSDMIDNFVSGITEMKDKLGEKANGIAETISSFLHFSLPEKGPLASSNEWMPDFMGNLAEGIEKNRGLVQDAIKNVSADMMITPNATLSPNGRRNNGAAPVYSFTFNIQNVNGVKQEDARALASNISSLLYTEIHREKAAVS